MLQEALLVLECVLLGAAASYHGRRPRSLERPAASAA